MIVCSILFLWIQPIQVKANQYEIYPVGKNYLDLSNIVIYNVEGETFAQTINPIYIKSNQMYTLVISEDMLGQYYNYLDYYQIEMETENQSHDFYFDLDHTKLNAYHEFMITEDWIMLGNIPMQIDGYRAILYEGTYQDFIGFEPFIRDRDPYHTYGTLSLDYDQRLSTEQIKALVRAYNQDGQELNVTLIGDQYTNSNQKPGHYEMVFQSIYNNTTKTFTLYVLIYDITPPLIIWKGPGIIEFSERLTLQQIKGYITVSDNVDDVSTDELVILENTYSSATSPGSYHIKYQLKDSSDNIAVLTIQLELRDSRGPEITGPAIIFVYTQDEPLTNEKIISYFSFYDFIDGINVFAVLTANEYMQTKTPGVYRIEIKATDQDGNATKQTASIHVIDNSGPVFKLDELILETTTLSTLSENEIIVWFKEQLKQQDYQASEVVVKLNEYLGHEDKAGKYYVYLIYQIDDMEYESRIAMNVVAKQTGKSVYYYVIGGFVGSGFLIFVFLRKRKKILN